MTGRTMRILYGGKTYRMLPWFGGYLTVSKDHVYKAMADATLEFESDSWHEIVDLKGNVLSWIKSNIFHVAKGAEFTVRLLKPPSRIYTKAEIDKARSTAVVTVVNQQRYESGPFIFGEEWTDGSLDRVVTSLNKIRHKIPKQYRAAARCGISSEGGYEGSHSACITISYKRPETDTEVKKRLRDAAVEQLVKERGERAQLLSLSAKYKEPASIDAE